MNIGLFTDTYFPQINGVSTSVHTLAEGLRKNGHNVYIFTPSDPLIKHKNIEDEENIIRMPSMPCFIAKGFRIGLLYTPIALNKIAHLKLDIIHTQTEFSLGMFARILGKTLNIPIIHTYHTMYVDYVHYIANGNIITPSMVKDFSKIYCNKVDAIIAPTKKVFESLNEYGVKKNIHIIPTGIDTNIFKKTKFNKQEILQLKNKIGIKVNEPSLIYIGRIAKEKSIDIIIKSIPDILKRVPNIKFIIVGDGPERENLENLSKILNLSKNVIFLGSRPWSEINKYYQLGDIFISASTSETQGLTFAEAMAAGLPIIAKRDECLENIVIHNKTGLLFDSPEQISIFVEQILNNKNLLKKYSINSIKTMENLSVENFILKVENLYKKTLENKKINTNSSVIINKISQIESIRPVKKIKKFPKKLLYKGKSAISFIKFNKEGFIKIYNKNLRNNKK